MVLKMSDVRRSRPKSSPATMIGGGVVSIWLVILTQFGLFFIPLFFSASSLLIQLLLSALVLVAAKLFWRCFKSLLGISAKASAPAFVFFNLLFIWVLYIAVLLRAISSLVDIILNTEFLLLAVGLRCIMLSDPGFVTAESPCLDNHLENSISEVDADEDTLGLNSVAVRSRRVRYCKICEANVKGFDHHCPAFGNCIGENNHALFMILLFGFLSSEASYIACSSHFATIFQISNETEAEINLSKNLVLSTMLFCILQVAWQVIFLAWHLYCVCFNIKTDEWINWKKYPEFHLDALPQPGEPLLETRFRNPYNKGVVGNVKEFLASKER